MKKSLIPLILIVVMQASAFAKSEPKLIMGFENGEQNGADGKPLWECKPKSGGDVLWKHDYSSCNLMVRNDKACASQGNAAGVFEIFEKTVPNDKMITFAAERWQSFDWAYGKVKYLDPNNMIYGEMEGPADWNSTRFYTIFSMFKNLQRMGDKKDWSGYDKLWIDVKSPNKATIRVFIEDFTKRSSYQHFEIDPGEYRTISFDLKSAIWSSKLDPSNICDIDIQLRNFAGPGPVFFDNIRLVNDGEKSAFPIVSDASPVFDCGFYSQYRPPHEMPPADTYVAKDRKMGAVEERITLAFKDIKQAIDYPTLFYISALDADRAVLGTSDRFFRGFAFFSKDGLKNVGDISSKPGLMTDLQPEWKWGEVYTDPCTAKGWEGRCGMALNFPDQQLRGASYMSNMTWCGSAGGGSGVPFFGWVLKVVSPKKDGWGVYPRPVSREERAKMPVPQDLDAVIVGDDTRGCVSWCHTTSLPSGRLWAAWKTNTKNSQYGWRVRTSLSDDLVNWKHPDCGTTLGPKDYPCGNYLTILPFGKDSVIIPSPEQEFMNIYSSDGTSPWKSLGKINIGWENQGLSVVPFSDKEFFAVWGESKKDEKETGKIIVWSVKNGTASKIEGHAASGLSKIKPMSSKFCAATLCGETLYLFWLDGANKSVMMQGFSLVKRSWDKAREIWRESEAERMPFAIAVAENSLPNCIMPSWNSRTFTAADPTKGTNNIWVARLSPSPEHLTRDKDLDGLDDESETKLGTDPTNPDCDGDTLFDGQEVNLTYTDPKKTDTDGDCDDDALELYAYSNPSDPKKMASKSIPQELIASATPTTGKAPLSVALDASGSQNLGIRWELGTKGSDYQLGVRKESENLVVHGQRAVYTFQKPGTYTVKAISENTKGAKSEKEFKINVQ